MTKTRLLIIKIIGALSSVGAALGLLESYSSYQWVTSAQFPIPQDPPQFADTFFIMMGISIVIHLMLLLSGILIVLQKPRATRLFIVTCMLMMWFFVGAAFLWLNPEIGGSVASATGVSGGYLGVFAITLFPLWAPFFVIVKSSRPPSTEPI